MKSPTRKPHFRSEVFLHGRFFLMPYLEKDFRCSKARCSVS